MSERPLIEVCNLVRKYKNRTFGNHYTTAVNDVSFSIHSSETLGLVGESGSGKSTTGRLLLGLEPADEGRVFFEGTDITSLSSREMKPWRRRMQVIFQDPYTAINPRKTIQHFIAEPLLVHGLVRSLRESEDHISTLLRQVGLDPSLMTRSPHEFSGGQRQRICIARALALKPKFIVADEPITALDVSIQAQIVNLFQNLQQQMGLSYLFISHDISMVRYLCHRVAVMFEGRIVETGPIESIFSNPQHSYTRMLLNAVPSLHAKHSTSAPSFDRASLPRPSRDMTMTEVSSGHFVLQN
ncbi:ABC transporter ATP-binding protein [Acetobacter okinawensis]|uniref:ATP-binding cassette domain-containing protein n=1 Tax=Acetobacter okinawensis TaxID=1076594 RepID=UPI001BA7621A|nr:ATP-binding cassette domain-containing protein [Acetobacter okinawensis]MBS0965692.1 ABC transporter ATP-binding protein [Acetobacter okinawensis]